MAYSPVDLGNVLRTAEAIKGARQQAVTAQLQQQYLGQQIQNNQDSAATNQTLGQQRVQAGQQELDANTAKQRFLAATAIAHSDDPIGAVNQFAPEMKQMFEQQNGPGSFDQLQPDQVKAMALHAAPLFAAKAGIAPPTRLITHGDINNPGAGITQENPDTGALSQVVAPQRIDPMEALKLKLTQQQVDEAARHNRAIESKPPASALPSGYRQKPDGTLEPIPGGPADKSSGGTAGLGGREGVMFQRVINSANSATEALKNISELPVGASTGFAGIGASPGASLLSSVKGALTNKLASQDVQDYNTMLAGVGRNLSTIETAGLAPNGSLTHSMDSIQLREGDSGITKLRKLAEMRQIIIKGIETNTSNPKLPQEQKDLVNAIIEQVKGAIPFTQSDITKLQQRQNKDPNFTFQDLMKEKGLGTAQPATPPQQPAQAMQPGQTYQHPSGATVTILP